MARGFAKKARRVLHSILEETVVFAAGVEMAEAHPGAAVPLAEACMQLVDDAMRQLMSSRREDEDLEKGYGEIEIAMDLFKSIVVGEPSPPPLRNPFPKELREEPS